MIGPLFGPVGDDSEGIGPTGWGRERKIVPLEKNRGGPFRGPPFWTVPVFAGRFLLFLTLFMGNEPFGGESFAKNRFLN